MSLGIHPSGLSQRPWVLDLVEKRGRVDVVRIGDSNENKGDANTNTTNAYNPSGTAWGWNHGFAHALHRMGFPCYGSGFASPFDNGGNGTHEGYSGHVSPVAAGEADADFTGRHATHAALVPGGGGPPLLGCPTLYPWLRTTNVTMGGTPRGQYLYGQAFWGGVGASVGIRSPLPLHQSLRLHVVHGRYPSGGGSVSCGARIDESPFTAATLGTIDFNNNPNGSGYPSWLGRHHFDYTPPANNRAIVIGMVCRNGQQFTAPGLILFQSWEVVSRTHGWRQHQLISYGGQSLRVHASILQALSDEYLTAYFLAMRESQAANPGGRRIVIEINDGLNDQNDSTNSVGPAPAPSNTGAGFADNIEAVRQRLLAVWALNSWDGAELFFVVTVSHRVSEPDAAALVTFRTAAKAYAAATPRVVAIDWTEIVTQAEMDEPDVVGGNAQGLYINNGGSPDLNHLTRNGYETLAFKRQMALFMAALMDIPARSRLRGGGRD